MAHETTTENEVQSTELAIQKPLPVPSETTSVTVKRTGLPPALWALIGVGLGVAGTMIAVSSRQEPKRQLLAQSNPPVNMAPGHGLSPTVPNTTAATTQQGAGAQSLAKPGSVTKDAPEAPMNPFGGSSFVLPKLPVAGGKPSAGGMSGFILPKNLPVLPSTGVSMKPGGPVPVPLTGPPANGGSALLNKLSGTKLPKPPEALKTPSLFKGGTPGVAPAKASEQSKLVTVSQATNDRQGSVDDLTEYAKKVSGKVQPLTEQGADGKPEVKGVLVTLPETSVDDLLKHLSDAGAVVDKQTWSGSTAERKDKLVEDATARIASLKKLREALLVTYMEDAQPVKDVDEEIAKATVSLDQLRTDKVADKMAIVRISFVKSN